MKLEHFKNLIDSYHQFLSMMTDLHEHGLDFFEGNWKLMEPVDKLVDAALVSSYKEEGVDWVYWFIFENDFGNNELSITDYDDQKISIDTVEKLYNFLEKEYKA